MAMSLHELIRLIKTLTPEEQSKLLAELTAIIHKQEATKSKRNNMEFKGMDQESWKDVDVEKYINEERNSWDG